MENTRKIGILLIVIAVAVAIFGVWLKVYNDKLAQVQVNETGSCYLPDGTCLHATSDTMMYAVSGLAAALVVIGAYLLLRKKEQRKIIVKRAGKHASEKPVEMKVEAPKTLGPETKSIFDLIAQSNGAILQGEIVTRSGLDKVKVSRILDKLEMQGLIERRRHGMSNLVVLKKK